MSPELEQSGAEWMGTMGIMGLMGGMGRRKLAKPAVPDQSHDSHNSHRSHPPDLLVQPLSRWHRPALQGFPRAKDVGQALPGGRGVRALGERASDGRLGLRLAMQVQQAPGEIDVGRDAFPCRHQARGPLREWQRLLGPSAGAKAGCEAVVCLPAVGMIPKRRPHTGRCRTRWVPSGPPHDRPFPKEVVSQAPRPAPRSIAGDCYGSVTLASFLRPK